MTDNSQCRYPLNYEAWYSEDFLKTFDYESRFFSSAKNLFFQPEEFYLSPYDLESCDEFGGQALLIKHKVVKIDAENHLATLHNGDRIHYQKCLLTSGSETSKLVNIPESCSQKVYTIDSLNDFAKLNHGLESCSEMIVLGNSLRALEFAACMQLLYKGDAVNVKLVCPSSGLLANLVPKVVADWMKSEIEKTGIKVIENCDMDNFKVSLDRKDEKLCVTSSDMNLSADLLVNMLPRVPRTEVALDSNLETDELGIRVDPSLKARQDLYVAGSCASIYHPVLQRRVSFDVPDNAVWSGRFAALNMLGKVMPYFKLPRQMGDFGPDLGFDGIGDLDSSLETLIYFVHKSPPVASIEEVAVDSSTKTVPQSDSNSISEQHKPALSTTTTAPNEPSIETLSSEIVDTDPLEVRSISKSDEVLSEDIESCAIIYMKDETVVGIATIGSFGRMYIAENMISHKVHRKDIDSFVPLLLSDKFKVKNPEDDEDL